MNESNDRRKEDRDHDLLTKIDANLSNFMHRFDEHVKEDAENYKLLDDRTAKLEKFMWVILGAVLIVNFAAKFIK